MISSDLSSNDILLDGNNLFLLYYSGVFKFIKDSFINSPSADLTPEVMNMLMAVMLVSLKFKWAMF